MSREATHVRLSTSRCTCGGVGGQLRLSAWTGLSTAMVVPTRISPRTAEFEPGFKIGVLPVEEGSGGSTTCDLVSPDGARTGVPPYNEEAQLAGFAAAEPKLPYPAVGSSGLACGAAGGCAAVGGLPRVPRAATGALRLESATSRLAIVAADDPSCPLGEGGLCLGRRIS